MPFTLFCHLSSPAEALRFLREQGAVVEGEAHDWKASFTIKKGLFGRKQQIGFTYELEWCSPPNWPTQLAGMANFVRQSFEMSDETRRTLLLGVLPRFRYSIGVVTEPEITADGDQCLELIRALASRLGAVIFTPTALLDPRFRAFASATGELDEASEIPLEAGDGSTLQGAPDAGEQGRSEHDDEERPLVPPSPARVARRLYALVTLAARALLDVNIAAGREPAYSLASLQSWAEAVLENEAEDDERALLLTPVGELSDRQVIDGVWVVEGAALLAWALKLAPAPPYDTQVEVDDLFRAVGFLNVESSRQTIASAALRPPPELEALRAQMLAYHWRMVDLQVSQKPIKLDEVSIFGGPFDLSWAKLANGDLLLQGQPIAGAEASVQRLCRSISFERFRAANWLLGHGEIYSETPTDT